MFSNQNILFPESGDSRYQYFNVSVSWLLSVGGLLNREGISDRLSNLCSSLTSLVAPMQLSCSLTGTLPFGQGSFLFAFIHYWEQTHNKW